MIIYSFYETVLVRRNKLWGHIIGDTSGELFLDI